MRGIGPWRSLIWLTSIGVMFNVLGPAWGLEDSIGPAGIRARVLHHPPYDLQGRKIAIGQVEFGRPPKFGWDKATGWAAHLNIAGVFFRHLPALSNTHLDSHATLVAAVMVSQHKRWRGVAPQARLYTSALGAFKFGNQSAECSTAQTVAQQNSDDVRAINFSFGEPLGRDTRPEATLNGQALLTQCIDWLAQERDVLFVVAGNQGDGGIPIPTDHFNGITTAYSTRMSHHWRAHRFTARSSQEEKQPESHLSRQFAKVDFANLSDDPIGVGRRLVAQEINAEQRRAVSLVAPGDKIAVVGLDGKVEHVSGTSFAAPHVTASLALLQEYGDRRLLHRDDPHWSLASRRHEVMKAVLLNASDKLKDAGDGFRLGMERTLLRKDHQNWLTTDAYRDPRIPLGIQMGTGHLNVWRAYQQFQAGQWAPEQEVAPLGWDFRQIAPQGNHDYPLARPLLSQSFAVATLVWDRRVELVDHNRNRQFDESDSFRDRGLNDLNLYLMPQDSHSTAHLTCSSMSAVDSVEHIFCPIPETGRYKLRVQFHQQVHQAPQAYALAWWTRPTSASRTDRAPSIPVKGQDSLQ